MKIGELIFDWRAMRKLNTRDVGAQIGVSASAILRLEAGKVPDGLTIIKLMQWLFSAEGETDGSPVQAQAQPDK